MRKRRYANFASTRTRFVNYILDSIIFNVMLFLVVLGLVFLLGFLGGDAWVVSLALKVDGVAGPFFALMLHLLYYAAFESLYGKSPAKFITKTKVVDLHGELPGWLDICGRSLCRVIPLEQLSFLFGQNWHDRFSNTSVVYDD